MDRFNSGGIFGRSSGRTYLISALCFIGFGAAVAVATAFSHYQLQQSAIDTQVQQQFRLEQDRIIERLRHRLRGLDNQLASLAANPLTHQFLQHQTAASTQTLRHLYLATIAPNTLYRQLCYLNSLGQTQLCVNRGEGYGSPGPKSRLNTESGTFQGGLPQTGDTNQSSSLFSEAQSLAHGDVKHSALQLPGTEASNRPSFQSATPVYVDGRLNGILVATLDVRHLLRELIHSTNFVVQLAEGDHTDPMVLNSTDPAGTRSVPSASVLGTPANRLYSTSDEVFRLPLGELLQNDQSLYLVMSPKQTLPPDFADDLLFNTLMIALLVILAALPLAWSSTRIPARLHRHLHQTLLKLRQSNRLLDQNLISSRTDTQGNFTHVSRAFCEISGYTRQELIGQPHSLVRHPDSSPKIYEEIWRTLSGGHRWHGELCNRDKQGHDCWVSTTIAPDFDRRGNIIGYTQISRDISDHKLMQQLSIVDPQTLLFNRRHLEAMLEQQLNLFQRYPKLGFSAILIRFDTPYDSESVEQEEALSQFGMLLRSHVRNVDLLGRWDERRFLIICPCTDIDGASILAVKLQQQSQQQPLTKDVLRVSIGVVQSLAGDNWRLLIGRAGQALQLALKKPEQLAAIASSHEAGSAD